MELHVRHVILISAVFRGVAQTLVLKYILSRSVENVVELKQIHFEIILQKTLV